MKTLQDYFNTDTINWFQDNNLRYKLITYKPDTGSLIILYNENFCLKIYDRFGHGFGITANVADKYDESIYENDRFSLTWAFEYLQVTQTASFISRTENQYIQNLPKFIVDVKNIVLLLNRMNLLEWKNMISWIERRSK